LVTIAAQNLGDQPVKWCGRRRLVEKRKGKVFEGKWKTTKEQEEDMLGRKSRPDFLRV
jgi:hypothetical protein